MVKTPEESMSWPHLGLVDILSDGAGGVLGPVLVLVLAVVLGARHLVRLPIVLHLPPRGGPQPSVLLWAAGEDRLPQLGQY
jgi:hypothetical protein